MYVNQKKCFSPRFEVTLNSTPVKAEFVASIVEKMKMFIV